MTRADGDIVGLHDAVHILWHIPNYFSQQKADFCYESPDFHFQRTTWKIRIYPNGKRINYTVGFVELHIIPEVVYTDVNVSLQVSIVAGKEKLVEGKCHASNGNYYTTFDKFIKRNFLLSNRLLVAPEGTLTIKLKGKPMCGTVFHKGTERKILDGIDALTRDFQTLLSTEQASDVTIRVKSQVFRAHRLILVTRSTVFAAMFRHDMKEKITGSIDIEDCEPSAFQEFLTFMYTGKMDNLSSENVFDILFLANKYDLSDLKQICIDFMKENLCLDIVCNVLSAADKFNLVDLQKSARELFLRNKKSVMKSENWISFIRENPVLATEILMDAIG